MPSLRASLARGDERTTNLRRRRIHPVGGGAPTTPLVVILGGFKMRAAFGPPIDRSRAVGHPDIARFGHLRETIAHGYVEYRVVVVRGGVVRENVTFVAAAASGNGDQRNCCKDGDSARSHVSPQATDHQYGRSASSYAWSSASCMRIASRAHGVRPFRT